MLAFAENRTWRWVKFHLSVANSSGTTINVTSYRSIWERIPVKDHSSVQFVWNVLLRKVVWISINGRIPANDRILATSVIKNSRWRVTWMLIGLCLFAYTRTWYMRLFQPSKFCLQMDTYLWKTIKLREMQNTVQFEKPVRSTYEITFYIVELWMPMWSYIH